MRKLTHQELVQRQLDQNSARLPFCVVLNNIRSLYNVGSIFRTADGAGLEKVWLCGVTGIPPDTKISKTALGAEKNVPWEYVPHASACLKNLKEKGYRIVLLEQTPQSVPYETFKPFGPLALVLGNETGGVADELLPFCDAALEIEMAGLKNSLNVTVAFGITAYHIRKEFKKLKIPVSR